MKSLVKPLRILKGSHKDLPRNNLAKGFLKDLLTMYSGNAQGKTKETERKPRFCIFIIRENAIESHKTMDAPGVVPSGNHQNQKQ